MYGMRKRAFLLEQLVQTLLVLRVFSTNLVPLPAFLLLIATFLLLQYIWEGYTPKILFIFPLIFLQLFGQLNQSLTIQYAASAIGGIVYFLPLKMYWLPQPTKIVGFRQDTLESNLHYMEFFPLDESHPATLSSIDWNHGCEMAKILEHQKIHNFLIKKIGLFIMCFTDKLKLKIGIGSQKTSAKNVVFCHGRGATPFMSSSILMHVAGKGYRVGGVQHSEVIDTGLNSKQEMKAFREREVKVRAAQLYQAIIRLDNEQIVLMGHSYGCATIIEAYHSLEPTLQGKISCIVLLDPWFFPLTQASFKKSVTCPLLILANEDFIKNPDMYCYNKKFLDEHKADRVEYILWKNGHHLHQTDLGFIIGNLLKAVKHSHMSQIFLDLNLEAIDKFMQGEKVEGKFEGKDLGRDYTPSDFYPATGFSN